MVKRKKPSIHLGKNWVNTFAVRITMMIVDIEESRHGHSDSDVHTLEDAILILEILSRRFFLRLNLPDYRSVLTGSGGSSKDGDGDTSF
ncbi:hypothetical protein Tco_0043744 [Tanacetum coccineum]